MNKKIITGLLSVILISCFSTALAYNSEDVNKRLLSCTPSKNLDGGGSTLYQISGLTGPICIFKIQNTLGTKPDLICKVPASRMREMTSYNPLTVQNLKKQFCVISIKSLGKTKSVYY